MCAAKSKEFDAQYVISAVLEDEITKIDDAFNAIEQAVSVKNATRTTS